MNRRLLMLAVTAVTALYLSGCGSNPDEIRVGLVTGTGGTSGSAAITDISSGIESYAADTSVRTRIYTASADTTESFAVQFDAAAQDKVRYVVCEGTEMEVPVYEAQNAHHDSKYLLFDGQPRKSGEYEATIRSNTECVDFNKEEMGFLAGYVAVSDGYRNLFYLTAEDNEAYEGFLRGVSYAMTEQGLSAGNVSVSAEFSGSDEMTPLRMTDALHQYNSGAEIILTDAQNIAAAVERAADSADKACATIGFDDTQASDSVRFSAVADRTGVVEYLLRSFDAGNAFQGGQLVTCGVREDAIRLSADYTRLNSFSQAAAENILSAMAEGTANGSADAGAESGENPTETAVVSVKTVEPVTPDGEAGL